MENSLTRVHIPALDALLGHPFEILDEGFVRVIDYMGGDESVVQAARVSYGKGTKQIHEDRGLIRYLMRHQHTTPFEMCELKLHVRAPMDCWRQWIRHRTANVNEYSTRYSMAIDSAQKTNPDAWRLQSVKARQGSEGFAGEELGRKLSAEELEIHRRSREIYEERLRAGIAREQARKDLPLSTYTEAYWKIDLHNLLHFLELRMSTYAQLEIRAYALCIGNEIVSKWCPLVWEAFNDYRVKGLYLSRIEAELIAVIAAGKADDAVNLAAGYGLLQKGPSGLKSNRERAEVEQKLNKLGLRAPWLDL